VLEGRVKEVLEDIIRGQCKEICLNCLTLETMPGYLHLFVDAKPAHTTI